MAEVERAVVALATRVTQISAGVSILIAVTAGGLLLGLLFLSLSALPRTSKKSHSLIYFGSIARTNIEAFVEDMKTITEDEYLDDLARQCHRTAEIAMQKYLWIQRAQWAWYTTLLPWLLTVYQLYKR